MDSTVIPVVSSSLANHFVVNLSLELVQREREASVFKSVHDDYKRPYNLLGIYTSSFCDPTWHLQKDPKLKNMFGIGGLSFSITTNELQSLPAHLKSGCKGRVLTAALKVNLISSFEFNQTPCPATAPIDAIR